VQQSGAAATGQATPPPLTPLEQGKKLFISGCANCHGMDGTGSLMRGMMPNIGDLTSPDLHNKLKDEDIEKTIGNGKDKMPPFKEVFKPDQIKLIVTYVRSLKK
jgi:mono/diheme cytochrome c family protein